MNACLEKVKGQEQQFACVVTAARNESDYTDDECSHFGRECKITGADVIREGALVPWQVQHALFCLLCLGHSVCTGGPAQLLLPEPVQLQSALQRLTALP